MHRRVKARCTRTYAFTYHAVGKPQYLLVLLLGFVRAESDDTGAEGCKAVGRS